jgi:hypothetical protein
MTTELEAPDYEAGFEPRTPPQDTSAEITAIGSALFSKPALRTLLGRLNPEACYTPAHTLIIEGMGRMAERGDPVDPITLTKELADTGTLARAGGPAYIHQIVNWTYSTATPDHVAEYADIVNDRALRRSLIDFGSWVVDTGYGTQTATADLAEHIVTRSRELRDQGAAAEELPTEDILDFVQHEDTYDWIVPGLLERQDRLILTASEGGGKSVLLRQLAITLAAGIHPFRTWELTEPVRVLTLDCENGAAASRRHFRPLLAQADKLEQPVRRGQFHIECRPSGLDLTRPQDRSWMMRRVEQLKPDILIIGPIYRLHAGDPNSEELARKVSVVIDEARATAGCAVLMEAHAPHHNGFGQHRNLRPLGSSLWMRWPEFGFGLRPVEDEKSASNAEGCRGRRVVPWRGMRDERDWPQFIKQGENWPWVTYRPNDADQYTGHSPTGAIW